MPSETSDLQVDVSCNGKFLFKMTPDSEKSEFKIEFYDFQRDNEAFKGEVDLQRLLLAMFSVVKELNPKTFEEKIRPMLCRLIDSGIGVPTLSPMGGNDPR